VASVDGSPITEATEDHWVTVQASTDYESIPKAPIPAGVVPDPPAFRACIAYLRSAGASQGHPRSNAELLKDCEANYQVLRAHILGILISFKWWEARAKQLGIVVTQKQVVTAFAKFRPEEYGSTPAYLQYLRRTSQSLADSYLRMRLDLITTALNQYYLKKGRPAFAQYIENFSRESAAKTNCEAADVVPNCSEYKGPVAAEARL
jgi:hypothetical protein